MNSFSLLLACARQGPAFHGQFAQDMGWDGLLRLAANHGLSAFLYSQLDGVAPEAVLAELRSRAHAVAVGNLKLAAELLRAMEAFQAAGIPVLPFKGPTLAALLYGDRAVRQFSDLDLLVPRQYVPQALATLKDLGYEAHGDEDQWFHERARERPLVRKSTGVEVDLHWGLMQDSFAGETGAEGLWERSQRVMIDGREIPTLGTEDLLLYLCVHGTKHQWASLGWVRDVAELIRARPGIGWSAVMTEAQRTGTRRMLLLGLWLAHELLAANVPEDLLRAAKDEPAVQVLAAQSVAVTSQEPRRELEGWELMRYRWRVAERWRERWAIAKGSLLNPSPCDWQACKLPRALWRLYPVIRPLRLVLKHAGRIHR